MKYRPGGGTCNFGVQYKNPGPEGVQGTPGQPGRDGVTGPTGPTGTSSNLSLWAVYPAATNLNMGDYSIYGASGTTGAASISLSQNMPGATSSGIFLNPVTPGNIMITTSNNILLSAKNSGRLQIYTSGTRGTADQFLGSDGAGNTIWRTLPNMVTPDGQTFAGSTFSGSTFSGSTGPLFTGPTGSILYYDGTSVTGNTGLTVSNEDGNSVLSVDSIRGVREPGCGFFTGFGDGGVDIVSTRTLTLRAGEPGEGLRVVIGGSTGTADQYLGSDGDGNTVWKTLPSGSTFAGSTFSGQTFSGSTFSGSTGPLFTGPTGSILYYDGSSVTGNTGFAILEDTGKPVLSVDSLVGTADINSGIFMGLEGPGDIKVSATGKLTLRASSPARTMRVDIGGNVGASNEYLGSDGNSNTIWKPVIPVLNISRNNNKKVVQLGATGSEASLSSITDLLPYFTGVTGTTFFSEPSQSANLVVKLTITAPGVDDSSGSVVVSLYNNVASLSPPRILDINLSSISDSLKMAPYQVTTSLPIVIPNSFVDPSIGVSWSNVQHGSTGTLTIELDYAGVSSVSFNYV